MPVPALEQIDVMDDTHNYLVPTPLEVSEAQSKPAPAPAPADDMYGVPQDAVNSSTPEPAPAAGNAPRFQRANSPGFRSGSPVDGVRASMRVNALKSNLSRDNITSSPVPEADASSWELRFAPTVRIC